MFSYRDFIVCYNWLRHVIRLQPSEFLCLSFLLQSATMSLVQTLVWGRILLLMLLRRWVMSNLFPGSHTFSGTGRGETWERGWSYVDRTILTAYIIGPSRGKGLSSLNSSVLYLRASSMMLCDHRFKYHNFSHLVVSSTEFGVTVKVSPLPPPQVAVDAVSYI